VTISCRTHATGVQVGGGTRRLRTCPRSLVGCCWESSRDRAGRSVDQADDDRVRGVLAVIAGTVSYLHMHLLVELHGQPGWVAAFTPLSVDGMIVAASTTLLAESQSGGRGGFLPWALLAAGSVASLAANVAVAEPTATGRVIAAWPSFALIGPYELLMRQIRGTTAALSRRPAGRASRVRTTP
jgi:hypothetical protein